MKDSIGEVQKEFSGAIEEAANYGISRSSRDPVFLSPEVLGAQDSLAKAQEANYSSAIKGLEEYRKMKETVPTL